MADQFPLPTFGVGFHAPSGSGSTPPDGQDPWIDVPLLDRLMISSRQALTQKEMAVLSVGLTLLGQRMRTNWDRYVPGQEGFLRDDLGPFGLDHPRVLSFADRVFAGWNSYSPIEPAPQGSLVACGCAMSVGHVRPPVGILARDLPIPVFPAPSIIGRCKGNTVFMNLSYDHLRERVEFNTVDAVGRDVDPSAITYTRDTAEAESEAMDNWQRAHDQIIRFRNTRVMVHWARRLVQHWSMLVNLREGDIPRGYHLPLLELQYPISIRDISKKQQLHIMRRNVQARKWARDSTLTDAD